MTHKRITNPTYFIVCEGEKTEPNFFKDFREYLIKYEYLDNREQIRIYPAPPIEKSPSVKRGAYKGKKRKTKTIEVVSCLEENLKGVPPLKWVLKAASQKANFDYVWAVFDKDEHPKPKEAFEEAEKDSDNPVHIAFSSICFEYYLLLHFEYLYYPFEKSECRKGKKTIHCCSDHVKLEDLTLDCEGVKCVNGYARKKKYWEETKKTESTFDLIKNNIWKGVYNANHLRLESELKEKNKLIWKRNPYVTIDSLITSLLGYKELKQGKKYLFKTVEIEYDLERLILKNISSNHVLIKPDNFSILYSRKNKSVPLIGEKILIDSGNSSMVNILPENIGSIFSFNFEEIKLFFVIVEG